MSSQSKKDSKKPAVANTKAEDCMNGLVTTVKLMKGYGESKLSENPDFKKLSGPRMGVLFIVQAAGTIRMSDLAGKLMVAPRTVTDIIDGLERDGFLRRVPDPSDRRAMFIELTPEFQGKFHKIADMRKKFSEEVFSVLSSKEQDDLIHLLNKLREGPLSKLLRPGESCQ